MPYYKYKCKRCNNTYDIEHKINQSLSDLENTINKCNCGGELKKVIGSPSIQFKGSNFYSNKE